MRDTAAYGIESVFVLAMTSTMLANIVVLIITNNEHINTLLFHHFFSSFLHKLILHVYITMIHCYFWLIVGPIILNVHVPKMSVLVGIRMMHAE